MKTSVFKLSRLQMQVEVSLYTLLAHTLELHAHGSFNQTELKQAKT
jgi:hypothetical protein